MDQWVKNKLSEWGLQKYEDIFEDEEVDSIAFRCLTEDIIKRIIPKAGPQSKFLYFWKSEFGTVQYDSENRSDSTTSMTLDPLACNSSSTTSICSLGLPFLSVSEFSGMHDNASSGALDVLHPQQVHGFSSNPDNAFSHIDSWDLTVHQYDPIDDLTDTLRQTAEGVAILTYYKANRDLTDGHRHFLVELILFAEIRSSENFALAPARIEELSQLIKMNFPTENIYYYYVPYHMDSVTKKKACAKGKLYDRYNFHRTFLLSCNVTKSQRGTKRKSVDYFVPGRLASRKDFMADECCTDDYQKKVEWLRNSIHPWSTVEKYWIDTSRERIKKLYETIDLSSETYISTYPALKDPLRGVTLIELDFATIYPDKVRAFYTEYSALEKELLNYLFKIKKKRLDSEVQILLQKIERNREDCHSSTRHPNDVNCAAVLRLLPLLLPPPGASKVIEKYRRPSKSDVQDEFLFHVATIEELDATLSARRKKNLEQGRSEQPLAVIVGSSLESITHCYVCIKDIRYEASSVLQAIDIAFKSFYALQLEFPPDAVHPWMVIQHRVYNIQRESDNVSPSVYKFLGELRQMSD